MRDRDQRAVFESGALHIDGSIEGSDNDADSARFEPHYTEIDHAGQMQIYEPILKDHAGKVHYRTADGGRLFERQPATAVRFR